VDGDVASVAQAVPSLNSRIIWFWEFLKEELAPYRGRALLVTRIVLASTLVMIISMTFRLPYGAYGGIFAITLSRESLEATASAVRMIVIGFLLAAAYVVLGLMLALADPILRFVWITGGFFIGFWALSALRNYAASARFGYLLAITVTLWDRHIPPELKVEDTLWALGVITLASIITLLMEIAFAAFTRSDDLIEGIAERLTSVEELLTQYVTGEAATASTPTTLARMAMTGTSRMRLILHRAGLDSQYAAEMGAVVALTGRLVDLAANLPYFSGRVSESDREGIGRVASHIREIRDAVTRASVPQVDQFAGGGETPFSLPLLGELEQTVSLIRQTLAGAKSLPAFAPAPDVGAGTARSHFSGKLLDPEHLRFALRGCLAATSCYVIFNALAWPELSTAVTTCFLTALTTIGASRQKQLLRFAGAIVGGFGLGIGSQIFVLPYIDSIAGFTVLYVVVIAVAAWFVTSSPRLSYFGVQAAVAFCLINLAEFRFQTSLAVARDRVVGVLLGLFMMWLFFDQLWSTPAGLEMKRTFISALRLLGRLARGPVSNDLPKAIEDSYVLREEINAKFDRVRSLADGVLFEFGPSRSSDLELRAWIRRWQPQLRALFVMRIALLKYRLQAPGFELPDTVRMHHEAYDDVSAKTLEEMADRMENRIPGSASGAAQREELKRRLDEAEAEASRELPHPQAQSFVTLLHGIDSLTNSLAAEVATDFPMSVLSG
jgi:multidrug resistance protein MdtO